MARQLKADLSSNPWLRSSNCRLLAARNDQANGSAIVFRDPEPQVRFVVIRREIDIAIGERATPVKIQRFYMVTGLLQALDYCLDIAPSVDRKIPTLQCATSDERLNSVVWTAMPPILSV